MQGFVLDSTGVCLQAGVDHPGQWNCRLRAHAVAGGAAAAAEGAAAIDAEGAAAGEARADLMTTAVAPSQTFRPRWRAMWPLWMSWAARQQPPPSWLLSRSMAGGGHRQWRSHLSSKRCP